MSTLSIRKMPKELERAIVREAKKKRKTKTSIVIEALQRRYQLGPQDVKRRSLRAFFGKMTAKEYEEFLTTTRPFSEIDREMWG